MSSTHPMTASVGTSAIDNILPSATPTLKVMRLQAPQLGQPSAGQLLSPTHLLSSNLLLPDSFGVIHIGEIFSAYLGVLNPSFDLPVRGLTLSVQLQTPSLRIVLPTRLGGNSASSSSSTLNEFECSQPKDVEPGGGIDTMVSRRLEEAGQHILRVEVGYTFNGAKTLRKFYRFNVTAPLNITETVTRSGDAACIVSITVENIMEKQSAGGGAVTIDSVGFESVEGLVSQQIMLQEINLTLDAMKNERSRDIPPRHQSIIQLYDTCGRLEPGESYRYLFYVKAESEAAALRGIAFGDEIGRAVLNYYKAMGESGRIHSSTVVCPPSSYENDVTPNSKFVVHGSGISVDVATAAVQKSLSGRRNSGDSQTLDEILPVTVEPIDPPSRMKLSVTEKVTLLVVNHSSQTMSLQLQMCLANMYGVVICGPSFITLGEIPPSGGSCTIDVNLVALAAGLFSVQGCFIVDLTTGLEIQQPALFNVFVEMPSNVYEEKKTIY